MNVDMGLERSLGKVYHIRMARMAELSHTCLQDGELKEGTIPESMPRVARAQAHVCQLKMDPVTGLPHHCRLRSARDWWEVKSPTTHPEDYYSNCVTRMALPTSLD